MFGHTTALGREIPARPFRLTISESSGIEDKNPSTLQQAIVAGAAAAQWRLPIGSCWLRLLSLCEAGHI